MLEVSLGADGSVLEVVPSTAQGAPRGALDPVVFPLDGLPQRTADSGDDPGALGPPDSWTGGFSFALWDRARRSVTAYRDHYGARPLYYVAEPSRLLLASEIPAILARLPSSPDLDEVSVMEYLTTGLLTDGRTFHRGVRRLPAGSRLLAGSGTPRVERYWDPWPGPADAAMSAAELKTGFRRDSEWYGIEPGAAEKGSDVQTTAEAIVKLLKSKRRSRVIGWRERSIDLADRLWPGLYDRAVLQNRVKRLLK